MSPSTSAPAGRAGSRTRIAVTSTAPRYRPPGTPRTPGGPRTQPTAVPRVPPPSGLSFIRSLSLSRAIHLLGSAALSHRAEGFIVQINLPTPPPPAEPCDPAAPCPGTAGTVLPPGGGITPAPPARVLGFGTTSKTPDRGEPHIPPTLGSHPEGERRLQLLFPTRGAGLRSGHPSKKTTMPSGAASPGQGGCCSPGGINGAAAPGPELPSRLGRIRALGCIRCPFRF